MKRISVESIIVMLLFVMFAASIGVLIIEGEQSYQSIISTKEKSENQRIGISYISKKIKQNDFVGNIKVVNQPYNDYKAIEILLQGDEEGYVTYIFQDQGILYELYESLDDPFDKDLAEEICSVDEQLSFLVDDQYPIIYLNIDGQRLACVSMHKGVD